MNDGGFGGDGTSPPILPCLRQVNLQGSWYHKAASLNGQGRLRKRSLLVSADIDRAILHTRISRQIDTAHHRDAKIGASADRR